MTLSQWIQANALNPAGIENVIACWTQPGFGADPSELSFLFTLWYVACSGDEPHKGTFSRNSDTANGAQERRFVGGSQRVPLKLARQARRHRRAAGAGAPDRPAAPQGARQDRPRQRRREAGDRGRAAADRARHGLPPGPARRPAGPADLDAHGPADEVRRDLRDAVLAGRRAQRLRHQRPRRRPRGLRQHPALRRPGRAARLRRRLDLAHLRRHDRRTSAGPRCCRGSRRCSARRRCNPVDFVEHDWTKERWTRGGPTAIHGPGTLVPYGPSVRRPLGRVHWAGTETATYWSGYMDGAVSSGKRAAAEVLAKLR